MPENRCKIEEDSREEIKKTGSDYGFIVFYRHLATVLAARLGNFV
jgi:hypothetical protein